MGFVVEITSRSGRVIERHRVTGDSAAVGRAFDNDVILPDPYVDAHHAVIESVPDGIQIRTTRADLPIWTGRKQITDTPVVVRSGDPVSIGRTHLRVFALDHPVPPLLAFDRVEQVFSSLTTHSRLLLVLTGFIALILGDQYLRSYQVLEFSRMAQSVIGYLAMTLAWASFWAVVARVSRGEPRFFHHWLVAVMAIALNLAADFVLEVIAFNSGSLTTVQVVRYLVEGGCLAFALTLNLRFALRQGTLVRHASAQGFAWLVVGYAILTSLSFEDLFLLYPEFDATVLPETFRFAPAITTDEFGSRTEALYTFTAEELE